MNKVVSRFEEFRIYACILLICICTVLYTRHDTQARLDAYRDHVDMVVAQLDTLSKRQSIIEDAYGKAGH